MIVSSHKKLIRTTTASKQKRGMSKVFQEQENIVEEERLLQMESRHIHFHKKCHYHNNGFWQENLNYSMILLCGGR